MQEDYVRSSPRVNAFDAQYSRLPLPPSRRASEQDTVLPSVEPETVDLVSPPRPLPDRNEALREYIDHQPFKRKAFPQAPYSREGLHEQPVKRNRPSMNGHEIYEGPDLTQPPGYPHVRDHQTLEISRRHRAHPSRDIIDLTSSPRRPPPGRAGDNHVIARSHPSAGPNNRAYVPEARRLSPQVRNDYHKYPVGARPHAYIPESDRMYQRCPPPVHDYVPLRR